ncbi:MAG TPA: hypothetical protein VN924_19520 [Bryobacteraceae bacterium]|jgi:hypothetical protein|nr:hypothetical protein [Bryobacteraceae bacterium]
MTLGDFAVQYDELCVGEPQMGLVGLLPWDGRIFGFPVGEYHCGDCTQVAAQAGNVRSALDRWATSNDVEVCVASVPAINRDWIALLPELGFHFVDFTLVLTLPGLQRSRLPESRITLRPAQLADAPAAAAVAGRAFQFGRYYADARFPNALAGLRFHQWIENAITCADERSVVFVMSGPGCVDGFAHVTIDNGVANLALPAIDVHLQKTLLGFELYLATLRALQRLGVKQVTGKISCANTGVANICAMLGFRFSGPEAVFHWHSPAARHLNPPTLRQKEASSGNSVASAS